MHFFVFSCCSGRYQFSGVEFVSIFACHCARVSYLEEFGIWYGQATLPKIKFELAVNKKRVFLCFSKER